MMRTLNPKLEALLTENRIFADGGGKKGGLVGNLTGRKQAVVDERKGQIMKATRLTVQFIEAEFSEWVTALLTGLREEIATQLAADLARQGFRDADDLHSAIEGLEQIELMVQGKNSASLAPEQLAVEWLGMITASRPESAGQTP